jgi:hypothetical protein
MLTSAGRQMKGVNSPGPQSITGGGEFSGGGADASPREAMGGNGRAHGNQSTGGAQAIAVLTVYASPPSRRISPTEFIALANG